MSGTKECDKWKLHINQLWSSTQRTQLEEVGLEEMIAMKWMAPAQAQKTPLTHNQKIQSCIVNKPCLYQIDKIRGLPDAWFLSTLSIQWVSLQVVTVHCYLPNT